LCQAKEKEVDIFFQDDTTTATAPFLAEQVAATTSTTTSSVMVNIDYYRLNEVISVLLANAIDCSNHLGQVKITVSKKHKSLLSYDVKAVDLVKIEIADSGPGLSEVNIYDILRTLLSMST